MLVLTSPSFAILSIDILNLEVINSVQRRGCPAYSETVFILTIAQRTAGSGLDHL